ncbi:MAG TPA: hypothetical protein VFJ77_03060 [Gaiellaceae bacterium]|nr:hypothetical protein [Gaiellaceae bacterium]
MPACGQRGSTGVMAPAHGGTGSRPGLMAAPGAAPSRPLLAVAPDAFDDFDLAVELRRVLWCAVVVLALALCGAQANL